MKQRENHAPAGWAADALACLCVIVMYLAGHDVWNDTGRQDFWHLKGPPYFDIRVFVAAYYALALITLGRLGLRVLRLWLGAGGSEKACAPGGDE